MKWVIETIGACDSAVRARAWQAAIAAWTVK
jgi:hypothetical protein